MLTSLGVTYGDTDISKLLERPSHPRKLRLVPQGSQGRQALAGPRATLGDPDPFDSILLVLRLSCDVADLTKFFRTCSMAVME